MDIHIMIDAPDEKNGLITFDTTTTNSKATPMLPLLEKLQKFIDHHTALCDAALLKQNPYFKRFSVTQQDKVQKEFREKYTLWDHENPPADSKAPMLILK